jgi:hypothetical protein
VTVRQIRERVGSALLRAGTELAFDQAALERGLATLPREKVEFSGAQAAVAMAGWVDSALLWLGWRVHPSAVAGVL